MSHIPSEKKVFLPLVEENKEEILEAFNISINSPPSFNEIRHLLNLKKKKPPNEFLILRRHCCHILSNKGIKVKMVDLSRIISEPWRQLSDQDKKFYKELYRRLKEEYDSSLGLPKVSQPYLGDTGASPSPQLTLSNESTQGGINYTGDIIAYPITIDDLFLYNPSILFI
jgi:hypothetical protein